MLKIRVFSHYEHVTGSPLRIQALAPMEEFLAQPNIEIKNVLTAASEKQHHITIVYVEL